MINTIIKNTLNQLLTASATSLTTATAKNVASAFINPGMYLITGSVQFIPAASTSVTLLQGSVFGTTGTLAALDGGLTQISTAANVLVNPYTLSLIPFVISVVTGATFFLVASATFTVSTMTAAGYFNVTELQR